VARLQASASAIGKTTGADLRDLARTTRMCAKEPPLTKLGAAA